MDIPTTNLSASSGTVAVDWNLVTLASMSAPPECVNSANMLPISDFFAFSKTAPGPKISFIRPTGNTNTAYQYKNLMGCLNGKSLLFKFNSTQSGISLADFNLPIYHSSLWIDDTSLAGYKNFLTYGGMTQNNTSVESPNSVFKNYSIRQSIDLGWGLVFPYYNFGSTLRMVYDSTYSYDGKITPTLLIYSTKGLPSTGTTYPNTPVDKIRYKYSPNASLFTDLPTIEHATCEEGVCAMRFPLTNLPIGATSVGTHGASYRGSISLQIEDNNGQFAPAAQSVTNVSDWLPLGWDLGFAEQPQTTEGYYPKMRFDFCIDLAQPNVMKIINSTATTTDMLWPAFAGLNVTNPGNIGYGGLGKTISSLAIPGFNGGKTSSVFEFFSVKADHEGTFRPQQSLSSFFSKSLFVLNFHL
jgi:hypothetical protein